MNFNTTSSLTHRPPSQPSPSLNHSSIHNKQNPALPNDDPLNSIRLGLGDLSVSGGSGYEQQQQQQKLQPPQQQYNYEYMTSAQNVLHSSSHSSHPIGDIIGVSGGGDSLNWGSSG